MQPRLEVADVFRDGADEFRRQFGRCHSAHQHRVLGAVIRCRTAELGGQAHFCRDCGYQRIQYHSCRNRHCPKCQGMARAAWVDQRETELLPVPYFHVVFTLPQQLAVLHRARKRPRLEASHSHRLAPSWLPTVLAPQVGNRQGRQAAHPAT